jgi:hypothetical protein
MTPEMPHRRREQWDDPDDDFNSLYDAQGNAVYEGVIVETTRGVTILPKRSEPVEYEQGTRFVVLHINVEAGLVKIRLESSPKRVYSIDLRHFRAVITDEDVLEG